MGRHRRSAAGRAATGRATGVTQTYDTYAGGYAAADSGDYAGAGDYATAGDHLTAGDYLNGSPYATAGMYDSPGGIHETGDLYSKSDAYLFAADPADPRHDRLCARRRFPAAATAAARRT